MNDPPPLGHVDLLDIGDLAELELIHDYLVSNSSSIYLISLNIFLNMFN